MAILIKKKPASAQLCLHDIHTMGIFFSGTHYSRRQKMCDWPQKAACETPTSDEPQAEIYFESN